MGVIALGSPWLQSTSGFPMGAIALGSPWLEIDFSGLRGGAIWALAVTQVYLGGPETRIRAGKSSADAEISVLQGRTTQRNQCIHIF